MSFDLLTTVEQGGCSAKLPPQQLDKLLKGLTSATHPDLLVGADTHDDASVWKISDEVAIIQTTDFFPPICSDPYEFGQIAATNALSDVFAMGGKALSALNLVMFPSAKIDIGVLREILEGGAQKTKEAGAILTGGHTIDDDVPKYGLAVTGIVHPEQIISNQGAKVGDQLILTKPIGTGTLVAGHKLGEAKQSDYQQALDSMKQLNRISSEVMQLFNVHACTDITGFSLAGHGYEMAKASRVTLAINVQKVPLLNGAYDLTDLGCIPGASFRNYSYVKEQIMVADEVDYNLKMLMFDAQTSGGILMSVSKEEIPKVVKELNNRSQNAVVIGEVEELNEKYVRFY
jgi:selenide,water dikinase